MALFTGKGDGGTTKVFGCDQQRISKSSELPEALGSLDELNAFIGFVKMRAIGLPAQAGNERIVSLLRTVQENLFIIQAEVAGAEKHIREDAVQSVEAVVYAVEREIPPLKGFSIAGGTELSALLDVARTLARRAERRLVAVADAGLRELPPLTKAYMNRLSSLLFALARLANHSAGVAEENPAY
jgi:cob(I)alamin adenosyltransferase